MDIDEWSSCVGLSLVYIPEIGWTQCPRGWCLGGTPILQAEPRRKDESGNTRVAPKGATPVYPAFPVFLVPQIFPLPGFDGLTVFRQRGTKNIGFAWLSPCYYHNWEFGKPLCQANVNQVGS